MTITASSIKKYAVSRDNAATWLYPPRGPQTYVEQPGVEPLYRLDGTAQIPLYFTLTLQWEIMTFANWLNLNALYSLAGQNLLLNYLSVDISGGNPAWKYAPAVWNKPPTKQGIKGVIVSGVEAVFDRVEWWLPA